MENQVRVIIEKQRAYFHKGITKDDDFRMTQLGILKSVLELNEARLLEALAKDLGKSEFEAYATEIGLLYEEIDYFIKNLKKISKPKKVKTPKVHFPAESQIMYEPRGVVLIMGPWNYPVQLLLLPLIGAMAAGNCSVLKPSEHTPTVAALIEEMMLDHFKEDYIKVVLGDRHLGNALVHAEFDHIFFTGSVAVGKIVMKAAAERLIPVTLELGGKSPCIVDKTARIDVAASRIIWGKLMNAGQTCVAPDYVYVHADVKSELIKAMIATIEKFYGGDVFKSKDYGKIVNREHLGRLLKLLEKGRILYGGRSDLEARILEPTLLDEVTWHDPVMQDEIFGPILPIMTYEHLGTIIDDIRKRPNPLALYVFSESEEVQARVVSSLSFGGGCINDTVLHVANPNLPFGGAGTSGIGSYHGLRSFLTFSHEKSIMQKSTKIDPAFKYPPYSKNKTALMKKML